MAHARPERLRRRGRIESVVQHHGRTGHRAAHRCADAADVEQRQIAQVGRLPVHSQRLDGRPRARLVRAHGQLRRLWPAGGPGGEQDGVHACGIDLAGLGRRCAGREGLERSASRQLPQAQRRAEAIQQRR